MFQEITTTGTIEGEDFQIWTPDAAQTVAVARACSVKSARIGTGVTLIRQIGYGFSTALSGATYNCYFTDATSDTSDFTADHFIYQKGTDAITFNGTIRSNKVISVGAAASTTAMVYVVRSGLTGVNQFGFYTVFVGSSAATTSIKGFVADVNTAAASYTCADVVAYDGGIYVDNGCTATRATIFDATRGITKHASGTITSQAIFADNHAYTGAWAINLASTNPSRFGGNLAVHGDGQTYSCFHIGSTSLPTGTSIYGFHAEYTIPSTATSGSSAFLSQVAYTGVAATIGFITGVQINAHQKNSGTITRCIGLYTAAQTQGGTGNAAICDNIVFSGSFFIHSTSANPSLISGYLQISNQADPGAVTDGVRIGSQDISAANATLSLRTETAVVTETVTSDRTLTIYINGTAYKICLKA